LIKPEDFKKLVDDIAAGNPVSVAVSDLVDTIKEMDLQLLISQNALELCLTNLVSVVPDLAEKVLAMSGRTEQKIKKKVAELAAGVVSQCEDSLQTYMVKAQLEAMRLMNISVDDLITEQAAAVAVEEEDSFVPNNQD
jgi:hypothetical protein